jgi:peptide/nickel transport system substrate-binding protein
MKKFGLVLISILLATSMLLAACKTAEPTTDQGVIEEESALPVDEQPADTSDDEQLDDTEEIVIAPELTQPEQYSQAPMLDDWDLPPVTERLPLEPKIVNEIPARQMEYEVGKYGGVLRTIRMDPVWDAVVWTVLEEPLVNLPGRWSDDAITPNIVQSYEVNAGLNEFTFTLREGMKWSDGAPFTTEDVQWTWDNFINNTSLIPTFPQWLRTGSKVDGTPAVLEVLDDYTFKFVFDGPYGGFLLDLTGRGYHGFIHPSHYMKQYHADFADPDALAALVDEWGYEAGEWYNLYRFVEPSPWNSGRESQMSTPTLGAYLYVTDGEPRIYERNPYYFKIDPAGQQLPYIDYIHSTYASDMETAGVQILAGEIDFAYEWVPLDKVALYKENEARGGYRILTNTLLHRTAADFFLNMTYEDDVWREVVQDVRFRQALDLAINKPDLVDTVYLGFADVSDMQSTEFNLAEANRILDEMGMEIGSDGYRTAPSGAPFVMEIAYTDWMTQYPSTAQLVAEQFRELDLNINLKQIDYALDGQLNAANELQATVWFTHGPVQPLSDDWSFSRWARLWWLWYSTNGEQGEQPPDEVIEFYDTIYSIRAVSPDEVPAIVAEVRRQMNENLWYLIPVENVTQLSLINNRLRNFPDAGYLLANSFAAEQYWFED